MIAFPVYVLAKDCGEVSAYPSSDKMQGYMEAVDVANDEYSAWDAKGCVVQLRVVEPKSAWLQLDGSDRQLSQEEFTEIKAKAVPYRDPERLIRSLGKMLGLGRD